MYDKTLIKIVDGQKPNDGINVNNIECILNDYKKSGPSYRSFSQKGASRPQGSHNFSTTGWIYKRKPLLQS